MKANRLMVLLLLPVVGSMLLLGLVMPEDGRAWLLHALHASVKDTFRGQASSPGGHTVNVTVLESHGKQVDTSGKLVTAALQQQQSGSRAVGTGSGSGSNNKYTPLDLPASVIASYMETQRQHKEPVPGGRSLIDSPAGHCPLAKGEWCGPYWTQHLLPALPPPRHDTRCPGDCSGAGWCNHATGACVCQAGWKGPACAERDPRRCFNSDDSGRDRNITQGGWVHTRCSGVCDLDIGMCYCPPDTKYGHRTDPQAPPGSKPLQRGRPLYWCNPNTTADGTLIPWTWNIHRHEDLLGPQGWCNGNNSKVPCGCTLDGLRGHFCDTEVEHFCANQCGGHGQCILGFCKCHSGWYGHDCALRQKGLLFMPVSLPDNLQPVVQRVPAAEDPPTRPYRKRPFIYVYDLDPIYNSKLLQYRLEWAICINRFFGDANEPVFVGYNAYSLETVFHELMLTSEHRTFDPEEADYFYVPLYISCLADMVGKSHTPFWPRDEDGAGGWGDRPYRMSMMALEAKRWLQAAYPYWNRTGGRDHIWLFTHDEAPCYQHQELWPSIWLSHWGRLDFPHGSNSSYGADNYTLNHYHHSLSGGWIKASSGAHPCHDPDRHLVVPVFKQPMHYRLSPYLGAAQPARDILFFFRGDLGLNRPGCIYSRCIRQTIWKHYQEGQWRAKHNALFGDHTEAPGDYSSLLARSKFCLVIPGDGWSARYEDAMTHGCVPVIIMDNTLGPFESLIDYAKFTIRVAEREVGQLVTILQAISDQQLAAMQEAGAHSWMRFRWNGLPLGEQMVKRAIRDNLGNKPLPDRPGTEWAQTADDDAFSTVIQWLYHRLPQSRKEQRHLAS